MTLVSASTLRAVVAHYRAEYREKSARELRFFRIQPTFEAAITKAALAQRPGGKRQNHQRRIPQTALDTAMRRLRLVRLELRSASTFAEIHSIVGREILDIHRVGELAVYDTALRIAAWRRLEPEVVYLHRGTRDGAKALGLDVRRSFIPIIELPAAFRSLRPYEIEDVLCLYKDVFRGRRHLPLVNSCADRNGPPRQVC